MNQSLGFILSMVFMISGCASLPDGSDVKHSDPADTLQVKRRVIVAFQQLQAGESLYFAKNQQGALDQLDGRTGVFRVFDMADAKTALVLVETQHNHGSHPFINGTIFTHMFLESYESVNDKLEWENRFNELQRLDVNNTGFYVERVGDNASLGLSEYRNGLTKIAIPSQGRECRIALDGKAYSYVQYDTEFAYSMQERHLLEGSCKPLLVPSGG